MSQAGEFSGQILPGGYAVAELIAAGGMGAVYRATQQNTGHEVAVKVLHPHLAQNAAILERFRREALAAASLSHPRILSVIDFHLEASPPFMVMPLLRGRSLQDVYTEEGPLHWARMARIAAQILESLGVAHAADLVHRDLKPANLYLTSAPNTPDEALLLDFGVAKLKESDEFERLTRTGELIGTPLFMAPEQARGEKIDGRVDLYALGLVAYALVSGRVPFPDDNPARLLIAIQTMEPHPLVQLVPDVNPTFAAIIHKAVHKDAAQRFQTAFDMRTALLPFSAQALEPSVMAPRSRRAPSVAAGMNAPTEIMEERNLPAPPQNAPAKQARAPQRTAEWQGMMPTAAAKPARAPQRTAEWQGVMPAPAPAAPAFAAPPPTAKGPQTKHIVLGVMLLLFFLLLAGLGVGYFAYTQLVPAPAPSGGVSPIPMLPTAPTQGVSPPQPASPTPAPLAPDPPKP